MNEEMQSALTELEDRFCNCRRYTTSDKFWVGDHEPHCPVFEAVADGELLKQNAELTRRLDAIRKLNEGLVDIVAENQELKAALETAVMFERSIVAGEDDLPY